MKLMRFSLVLAAALGMAGCVDTSTVVTVNPDGSGTIAVREYFSPQMLEMMDSMTAAFEGMAAGMMEGMTATAGDESGAPKAAGKPASAKTGKPAKTDFISQCIENGATEFGTGVKLTKSEKKTNTSGWKGYAAEYSFTDVTQLQIPKKSKNAGSESGMSSGSGNSGTPYRFEFTKGPTATLKLVPQKTAAADVKTTEGSTKENADAKADLGAAGDEMNTEFASMLKGARFAFIVRVKGTVVDTNARYKSALDAGAFTLYAINMDEALKNKTAAKLLSANDPSASDKFADMDVPGIKVEDPDKTITIAFK